MCAHSDGVPRETMDRAHVERLLDELLPSASLLTPSAGSEPLLGDFDLMVEMCRKHELHLNLITNGTLLKGKRFREIADRIQKLYISFDSHVPEIYEKIRTPATFEKTVSNIREILPIATEMEIPVGFVVVLMADNVPRFPDYIDFIADLGGDRARVDVRLQRLIHLSKGCKAQDVGDLYTPERLLEILHQAMERARERGIILVSELDDPLQGTFSPVAPFVRGVSGDTLVKIMDIIKERYYYFCSMASCYLKIEPTGSVFPCCRSPEALYMGNVLTTPFDEIWNNKKYRSFRKRMNAGDYPECCRTCDVLVNNPFYKKNRS
jgi:radical SAM protein with 4Fe4S-binding SPASM domain